MKLKECDWIVTYVNEHGTKVTYGGYDSYSQAKEASKKLNQGKVERNTWAQIYYPV